MRWEKGGIRYFERPLHFNESLEEVLTTANKLRANYLLIAKILRVFNILEQIQDYSYNDSQICISSLWLHNCEALTESSIIPKHRGFKQNNYLLCSKICNVGQVWPKACLSFAWHRMGCFTESSKIHFQDDYTGQETGCWLHLGAFVPWAWHLMAAWASSQDGDWVSKAIIPRKPLGSHLALEIMGCHFCCYSLKSAHIQRGPRPHISMKRMSKSYCKKDV